MLEVPLLYGFVLSEIQLSRNRNRIPESQNLIP